MVQQAGIVALRDGEPCIAELREHFARRRAQVKAALEAIPGVSLPDSQGAFFAFPKFRFVTDSTAFTAALVRETGVALAPGGHSGVMAKATSAYALHPLKPRSAKRSRGCVRLS